MELFAPAFLEHMAVEVHGLYLNAERLFDALYAEKTHFVHRSTMELYLASRMNTLRVSAPGSAL